MFDNTSTRAALTASVLPDGNVKGVPAGSMTSALLKICVEVNPLLVRYATGNSSVIGPGSDASSATTIGVGVVVRRTAPDR
jgi:hypothetical protein